MMGEEENQGIRKGSRGEAGKRVGDGEGSGAGEKVAVRDA